MKTKVYIKIGDKQPLPCSVCKKYAGYQYADLYRMSYTTFYTSDGKHDGGQYNDGRLLNEGIITHCNYCLATLPFKSKRNRSRRSLLSWS